MFSFLQQLKELKMYKVEMLPYLRLQKTRASDAYT